MKLKGLLSLFLLVTVPSSALAFDQSRKGFILGGGLGVGMNSFTQELTDGIDTVEGDRDNKAAFVTDFKIGGGTSEQLLIYFHNHLSWFTLENVLGDNVTIGSGVTGLGVTWYATPEPGGFFVTGTLGVSYWDLPFEDQAEAWTGPGAIFGAGVELAPHWSLDVSIMVGRPEIS